MLVKVQQRQLFGRSGDAWTTSIPDIHLGRGLPAEKLWCPDSQVSGVECTIAVIGVYARHNTRIARTALSWNDRLQANVHQVR